jgi:hypothetical protein
VFFLLNICVSLLIVYEFLARNLVKICFSCSLGTTLEVLGVGGGGGSGGRAMIVF